MNGFFYGLAAIFEWVFKIIKPIGMYIDWIFIFLIAFGSFYWMYYDRHVDNGGKNFMSEKVKEQD